MDGSMWRQPRNQLFPWMEALSGQLQRVRIPTLRGPNLWVSADYVFGNSESQFDVIAVLLVGPERSSDWEVDRQRVRMEHLGAKRRMAFKSLGDGVRQKSFVPFLQAADRLGGAIVSIAIDKTVSQHFVFGPHVGDSGVDWLQRKWKPKQLDRMSTIAHFVAFLVAGVSGDKQNIYWISDEDDIFANAECSRDTGTMFTRFLSTYSMHPIGAISIGTTAITEADLLEEDLAAIADIAAGGTAELLTAIRGKWGHIPAIAVEMPKLPTRTELFFDWFQNKSSDLKKIGCVFEQYERALRVSTWT